MKNKIYIVLTFTLMSVLFTSCPYYSEFSLDAKSEVIDEKILGTWIYYDLILEEDLFYYILKDDNYTYRVIESSYFSTEPSDSGVSNARIITFGGVKLIEWFNGNSYLYGKYQLSENKIYFYFFLDDAFRVDEKTKTFESAREFNDFVKGKVQDANFYDVAEVLERYI